MLIILEGFDNSGKSTLGQQLQSLLDWNLIHSTGFHDLGKMEDFLWGVLEKSQRGNLIVDRISLISEDIYGPIMRGKSMYSFHRWLTWWERFERLNPLIIFCDPPLSQVQATFGERAQETVGGQLAPKATAIIHAYRRFFATKLPHMFPSLAIHTYDYTDDFAKHKLLGILLAANCNPTGEFITAITTKLEVIQGEHRRRADLTTSRRRR